MLESSGIPNYEIRMGPLPYNYFENDPRERFSSKKRVTPVVNSQGYHRFNDSKQAKEQIEDDLIEFERYAKFDVASLEATQIREAIIEDMNIATPAAMFTGSLNDWQEQTNKEMNAANQFDYEFVIDEKQGNPGPPVPAHLSQEERAEFKSKLIEQHDGQLGQVCATFSSLLDFNSEERFSELREVTCELDYNESFKRGLNGEGLEQHSLETKMRVLRDLQEKVDQYDPSTSCSKSEKQSDNEDAIVDSLSCDSAPKPLLRKRKPLSLLLIPPYLQYLLPIDCNQNFYYDQSPQKDAAQEVDQSSKRQSLRRRISSDRTRLDHKHKSVAVESTW